MALLTSAKAKGESMPRVANETVEKPVKLEKVEIPPGSGNFFKLNAADKKAALARSAAQAAADHPAPTEVCPECGGTGRVAAKAADESDEPKAPKATKADLLKRAGELGIEGLSERSTNADIEAAIVKAEADAGGNGGQDGDGADAS